MWFYIARRVLFAVPIALGVLFALFAVQRFGTEGIGRWFGPIMVIWFALLFALGVRQIVERPEVLIALSPHEAVQFAIRHKFVAFMALGAVTLAISIWALNGLEDTFHKDLDYIET